VAAVEAEPEPEDEIAPVMELPANETVAEAKMGLEVRSPRKNAEWPEPEDELDRIGAPTSTPSDAVPEIAEPAAEAQDEARASAEANDAPELAIDSPHDATQYIPREFVDAALDGSSQEPPPAFEIGDPAEMPEPVAEWETHDDAPVIEALSGAVLEAPDDPEVSALLGETVSGGDSTQQSGDDLDESAIAALLTDDEEDEVEPQAREQQPEAEHVAEAIEEPEETPMVEMAAAENEADEAEAIEEPEETPMAEVAAVEPEELSAEQSEGGNGNGDHGWEPPDDLEALIARFNAMQRVIYRSIRSEVGAGATNFVRSCGGNLEHNFGDVFAKVDLQPDGAWDPGGLRQVIVDQRLDRPWDGFQRLLDQEIDKLRIHIGEARATGLLERLGAIEA
jgi:hypothetical protein